MEVFPARCHQFGNAVGLRKKEFNSYVNNKNTCVDFSWEKTVKRINCAAGHKATAGCQGPERNFLCEKVTV